MEHRVCRASNSHVRGDGVLEGGLRHDLLWPEPFLHQPNGAHTGLLRQTYAGGGHCGNRAVAGEAHAQCLRQAVHRVGREEAGARSAAGAGGQLQFAERLIIDVARFELTHGLKHAIHVKVTAACASGHHRPAADEDGGDIHASGGHQHARHDLVAVGDHDQPVHRVGQRHALHRIGHQFATRQREVHADVPHGDPIADADDVELQGDAASQADASFDGLGDLVQVDMARDELVVGIGNADDRTLQLLWRQSQGVQQAPVWSALESSLHLITVHVVSPFPRARRQASPFDVRC